MFTAGDVLPFVRLGKQLSERGHRVTLATHASYRPQAEAAGLALTSWDTQDEHDRLLADGRLFDDLRGFRTMYERHVIPRLHAEAEALSESCDADTVVVTRAGPALAARFV